MYEYSHRDRWIIVMMMVISYSDAQIMCANDLWSLNMAETLNAMSNHAFELIHLKI